MKNLFDYATKELSQDAFLRWILENYDCPENDEVRHVSQKLIAEFCGFSDEEYATSVKTFSQWGKIDIRADIETNQGRKIYLFIEDKVGSEEHSNQLSVYNERIGSFAKSKEIPDSQIKKTFYKTFNLSEWDEKAISYKGWQRWDISKIYNFFKDYENTNCMILDQYISHIQMQYKYSQNDKRPTDNNMQAWLSYFEKAIKPRYAKKYHVDVYKPHYPYACIALYLKGKKDIPYLEVRSRDFLYLDKNSNKMLNNHLVVRLLCYGIKYNQIHTEDVKEMINYLKLSSNGLLKSKDFTKNKPKQIGRTVEFKNIETDEQFFEILDKCAEQYDEVISMFHMDETNEIKS